MAGAGRHIGGRRGSLPRNRKHRKLGRQLLAVAFGTERCGFSHHQLFEAMFALLARVLENRHPVLASEGLSLGYTRNSGPFYSTDPIPPGPAGWYIDPRSIGAPKSSQKAPFSSKALYFLLRLRLEVPSRTTGLAGVMQSGGDAVNRRADRVVELFRAVSQLFSPQQVDLNERHRIDIRVAQTYGP